MKMATSSKKRCFNTILIVSFFSLIFVFLQSWEGYSLPVSLLASGLGRGGTAWASMSRAVAGRTSIISSTLGSSGWDDNRTESATHLTPQVTSSTYNVSRPTADTVPQDNADSTVQNITRFGSMINQEHGSNLSIESNQIDKISSDKPTGLSLAHDATQTSTPQRNGASSGGQIIIVTTKRSGSSFVGELFNSNNDIFYMYEPLFRITFDVLKHRLENSKASSEARNIWNHTLRCNYSTHRLSQWLRRGNLDSCDTTKALKETPSLCPKRKIPTSKVGRLISRLCSDRPYTVLKTIRVMDIQELKPFLEDPTLNVKILHLVRDPRAVMNSRIKLNELNSDLIRRKGRHADEIKDLCEHMTRNVKYGDHLPAWLKGRYVLVRFEDVAKDPVSETRRIYSQLGIKMHQSVVDWIEKNTKKPTARNLTDPFSRTRDTQKVLNSWKDTLAKPKMQEIATKCRDIMKRLSYEREIV